MKRPTAKQWAKLFNHRQGFVQSECETEFGRTVQVEDPFSGWDNGPLKWASLTVHPSGRITRTLNGKKVGR